MPRHTPHLLRWSPDTQTYELSAANDTAPVELTPATLLSWLDQVSSFAFHSQSGAYCTVRKENIQGNGAYWYGYRSLHRRTIKRYLGRTADLSLTRLEKVAASFLEHFSAPEQPALLSQTPPLEAKLHPPHLPHTLVERPRLYAQLDAWSEHKLTLLSAPAGSGKTTLVNAWLKQRSLSSVAWISLDSSDNDPIRFWYYLLTACQDWTPNAQQQLLSLLHSTNKANLQTHSLEDVLSHFLNQLHKDPCLLILEDYHVISEPRIHETFGFLLTYMPETFHVLVLTRHDPPYTLGRLRANGAINELQARELRFSYDETVAFLQQTLSVPLSSNMLEQLETHLDGWAAGLRLLTLSLQGTHSEAQIEHLLTTLRGNHRPIRDYFVTEVLHTQPPEIQEFLLRTSLLTHLSPSLCTAITGRQDSAQLLDTIERTHLFLEALDGSGEWYRYHALFAEAMQAEARRHLAEQEISVIFQAASLWFEEHGRLPEAIEAALKLTESKRAAYLIEQHVKTLHFIESYEHHTLLRWLQQIPEAILREHPLLCLGSAVALAFTQNQQEPDPSYPERLENFLLMAEAGWQDDHAELGKVLAFRAFFSLQQGKPEQATTWARQALAWLPDEETIWRGMSLIALGLDALQAGNLHEARPHFQQIYQSKKPSNAQFLDGMTIILGMICLAQGDLHQAAHYYGELCKKYNQAEGNPMPATSHLALAVISYEWNMLDKAEQQLQTGLQQAKLLANDQLQFLSTLLEFVQALLLHAQGETTLAIKRLTTLLMQAQKWPQISQNDLFLFLYQEILSWLVRYALLLGDHTTAQHWIADLTRQHTHPVTTTRLLAAPSTSSVEPALSQAEVVSFQPESPISPIVQEGKALLLARLHLARGDAAMALTILQPLLPVAHAAGRGYITLQIRLLLAQAYAICKQSAAAQQILLKALEQGYAGGFQRSFLDEGDQLFLLLHDLFPRLQSPPLQEYVQTLFRAFRQVRRETRIYPEVQTFLEPLSKQEKRVLRLLVAGRSNQDIAQELVVSINTIRTQVQSIYRKLQVNNRQAASEIARNLNLL